MIGASPGVGTYTTPNGQTVQLPHALAAQYQGFTPVPDPTAPLVTPPPQPAPVTQVPAQPAPPPMAARTPVAPDPAPAPPPPPMTTKDLQQQGFAGVYNAQNAALGDQAAAGRAAADAEAKQQEAYGAAYADRNAKLDDMFAARAKQVADDQAAIAQRTTQYGDAVQKYSDAKIDRGIDHPILAAIAVALGGLGAAMKNDGTNNVGLTALYTAIDRKVAGQMADMDKQGKVLGMRREQLDLFRQNASDRLAQTNLMIAAESQRAANHIEQITATSNSDIVKANGAKFAAELRGKAADALAGAVDRQSAVDQAAAQRAQSDRENRRSVGVQYAGIKENARQHDADALARKDEFGQTMAYNREKDAADRDAAIKAAQAKGDTEGAKALLEMQKSNEERGISDVDTGAPLLQPEGQKLQDQAAKLTDGAAKLRAEAAKATDPAEKASKTAAADAAEQQAAAMSGEAVLKYQWRAGSPDQKAKIGETIAGTQGALDLIDDIKGMRAKYGASWATTSDGQAAMQAKGIALMMSLKNAWQLGVLSKDDTALLDKATGGDPAKLTLGDVSTYLGTEGVASRLDALGDVLEQQANNSNRVNGYRGNWKFHRGNPANAKLSPDEQAAKDVLKGRTAAEQASDAERGKLGNAVETALYPLGDRPSDHLDDKTGAGTNGYGLDATQANGVQQLITAAQGNGATAAAAKTNLLNIAASPRESVRNGVLNTLRDQAPDLYQEALAKLPADEAQYRTQGEAQAKGWAKQRVLSHTSAHDLADAAVAGDDDAFAELGRRVGKGDRDAIGFAQQVLMVRQRR